jgi:hypothetical protein
MDRSTVGQILYQKTLEAILCTIFNDPSNICYLHHLISISISTLISLQYLLIWWGSYLLVIIRLNLLRWIKDSQALLLQMVYQVYQLDLLNLHHCQEEFKIQLIMRILDLK